MFTNDYCRIRAERRAVPDQTYLLTFGTAAAQPWFSDWNAGRACVREMRVLQRFGLATSLAWVMLPQSLHWLVLIRSDPLGALVRRFKSRSALMINRTLGRGGQVWETGFECTTVGANDDLMSIARVILATPIEHGLATDIGSYSLWDAWWIGADQAISMNHTSSGRAPAADISVPPDAAVKEGLRPTAVSHTRDGALVRRVR